MLLRLVPCLLTVLVVVFARPVQALPCRVADVPLASLRAALARLDTPPPPTVVEFHRWRALLPARMGASLHNGWLEGDAWSWGTTPYERTSSSNSLGYTLRMDWDLRALWAPTPVRPGPGPTERLQRALRAEELARRAATQLERLRKAQALAAQAQDGDYVCRDAQAQAEAATLVLGALLGQ